MAIKAVRIESHIDEVTEELEKKLINYLEAIGIDAASTAASVAPVDTGRLKNSISHEVVPEEACVYIGTSVKNEQGHCYAIDQEFGTSRGIKGRHFIQFGATAHQAEYKRMLENILEQ